MGGIKAIYEMIPTSVKKELKKEAIEKAKKFISKIKKDKKEDVNIKKYLETKYIEFSYLMPLALDQRVVLLKELYYPLTIKRKGEVIEIKGFDISLFKTKNRIIIEDDAGMGKSTLMKFLFLTNYDSMDKDYIPVFFELRNYDTKLLFKENIINSFKKIECDIDDDFFKRKLIFFLDGFDEIKEQEKPIVAENIKNFTNSNNDNFYILSTRKDKYIESLSSYIKYNIKPLEPEEGIELLKRYVDKNEDKKFFDNIVEEESLESFLSVPLLASMIYMAYKPKENLPKRKVDLYDQVFEALYTSHDRNSKGGYIRSINYTSQKIIDILCKFSFKNIINLEVLYLKEEIEKQLLSIKDEFLINNISDLLETLTIKVPLFTSNFNTYFWKHKSFQEYFIALYISRNNQKEKIIKNMINSEKNSNYYNILEFLYELEKNIVLKEILEVIKNKYREIEKKINISDERIINLLVNNTEVYLKKNLIETIDGYVTLPCPIFEDKYEEEKNLLIEELEKEYQGDFQNLELNYSGQSIKYKKYYGNRVYLMKKTNIPILLKLLKNKKVHIVKDINNLKNKKYETKNFFEKNMWIKIDVETIRVENLKIEVVTDHMNSFGIINISEVERLYKNEITIYELNKLNLNENNIIENL